MKKSITFVRMGTAAHSTYHGSYTKQIIERKRPKTLLMSKISDSGCKLKIQKGKKHTKNVILSSTDSPELKIVKKQLESVNSWTVPLKPANDDTSPSSVNKPTRLSKYNWSFNSDSEQDPFATDGSSDEYVPHSNDSSSSNSETKHVLSKLQLCKKKLFDSGDSYQKTASSRSQSPILELIPPIEMQPLYVGNSETLAIRKATFSENDLPVISSTCELHLSPIRSDDINNHVDTPTRSSSVVPNFHLSPIRSDDTKSHVDFPTRSSSVAPLSFSPLSVDAGSASVAAYLCILVDTSFMKMTAKTTIHRGSYTCSFTLVDKQLIAFIFETTTPDHECSTAVENEENRSLVIVTREHSKEMQTVTVNYCISPGNFVGEELKVSPELSVTGLRREEIVSQTRLLQGKKTIGKKHCCVYCKNFYVKISDHLMRIHSNEEEVMSIKKMVVNSKGRNTALKKLRLKGDFQYNMQVKSGVKITCREFSEGNTKDAVTCEHCSGLFSSKNFARHERRCGGRQPNYKRVKDEARKASLKIQKTASVRELTKKVTDDLLLRIHTDCILHEIVSDSCLKLATEWYAYMHRFSTTSLKNDRQHLRRMARLLLEIKSLEPTVLDYEDCFLYASYDIMLHAVYKLCAMDFNTGQFGKPSLAQVLRSEISFLLKTLSVHYKKENYPPDAFECQKLRDFKDIHDASYGIYVGRCAGRIRLERKALKPNLLPTPGDVKLFSKFIITEAQKCYRRLKECGFDYSTWLRLGKAELAKIIVFNRRRVSEVASMSLNLFNKRSSLDEERKKNLAPMEKALAAQYKIMTMIGKRHHILHILLNDEQCEHLQLFVTYRKDANVPEENTYLFGVPTTDRYIDASAVLREFSLQCGAVQPSLLRTTLLRKQIATMAQLLSMNDNEIKMIAKLMGHSHIVHEQVYRQDEHLFQLTSWAKFLSVASEEDLFKYRGMTLDELCRLAENITEDENEIRVDDHLTVEEILGETDASEQEPLEMTDDLDTVSEDNLEGTNLLLTVEQSPELIATSSKNMNETCSTPEKGTNRSLKSISKSKKSTPKSKLSKKKSPVKGTPKKTTEELLQEVKGKVRRKKICFTKEQRNLLNRHFSQYIKSNSLPPMAECEHIVEMISPLRHRTARDIYNWVQYERNKFRNGIKHSNK